MKTLTMEINEEDRRALEALEKKWTEWPWVKVESWYHQPTGVRAFHVAVSKDGVNSVILQNVTEELADFIVALRNVATPLIRALRERVKTYEDAMKTDTLLGRLSHTQARIASLEAENERLRAVSGLPKDLLAVLQNPSIIVSKDSDVFKKIAEWANARSDTP